MTTNGIDLSKLPPVPGANPKNDIFGVDVAFQLVNCTPRELTISTFNQGDALMAVPKMQYKVPPYSAGNCAAAAFKRPYFILFKVDGGPVQAMGEALRAFAVQNPSSGAIEITQNPPESKPADSSGPSGTPAPASNPPPVIPPRTPAPAPPKGEVPSNLPEVPAANPNNSVFGVDVTFQLVNCTKGPIDVVTYNQMDAIRGVPAHVYKGVPAKGAVNCTAVASKRPYTIQYQINNSPPASMEEAVRAYAVQDPKTGAITVTTTPPAQDNSIDSALDGAVAGIRKTVVKAMDVPRKLALEAARKVLGEAGYTALCLAIGLAKPGHAGFHLTNATGGTINVMTYNQDDLACLVAANQYVIAPGHDATCEAKAVVSSDKPKGIQYRLNGAPKAVFMDDGALMMAVQDPATGAINLVEETVTDTVMRLLGKHIGTENAAALRDLITKLSPKEKEGFLPYAMRLTTGKDTIDLVKGLAGGLLPKSLGTGAASGLAGGILPKANEGPVKYVGRAIVAPSLKIADSVSTAVLGEKTTKWIEGIAEKTVGSFLPKGLLSS